MTAPVTERLRADTRSWHDALEATGFAAALLAGALPLERYVGQLAAQRVVLEALEEELSGTTSPKVAQVWSADLAKLPLVERDLAYFGEDGRAPIAWTAEEAGAFAREIRGADAHALLGFLYVLEGSTLGTRLLRRHVCAAFGLDGPEGVAYYGSGDRARWIRLTARLNRAVTDPAAQDRVLAAAVGAYRHTAAVAEALSEGLPPTRRDLTPEPRSR